MLRVKIKEINGEFDREFNLNTTTSDFYYKKFFVYCKLLFFYLTLFLVI